MSDVLHPWFTEARLTARRQLGAWRWRVGTGVLAIASLFAGAAWAMQQSTQSGDSLLATGLQAFARWPVPIALLLAGLGYRLTRSRLLALSQYLRTGWWAAAPVDTGQLTRTSLLVSIVALAAVLAAAAVLLTVIAVWAEGPHAYRAPLMTALAVVAAGLIAGNGAGTLAALRGGGARKAAAREGRREPLFAWAWLDDRRLPHLCDWQRRETVLRWRRGGNAGWIAAAVMAIPGASSVWSVGGVLLLVTLLAWLDVAQRAGADSAMRAAACLRATPLTSMQFLRAGLRYPVFAAMCALVGGLLGIAVLGLSWRAMGLWALLVTALSMRLPLAWWWHVRRTGTPR